MQGEVAIGGGGGGAVSVKLGVNLGSRAPTPCKWERITLVRGDGFNAAQRQVHTGGSQVARKGGLFFCLSTIKPQRAGRSKVRSRTLR